MGWNEGTKTVSVVDGGGVKSVVITGFANTNHTHSTLTRGSGLSGSNYDGSASTTWNVVYGATANTAAQGNTTAEVVAGDGLTGGLESSALGNGFIAMLNIGQGDGIVVNDDDISVNFGGSGSETTVARSEHSHSTHTRGTGLTGGNYNGTAPATWAVSYGSTGGTAVQGNVSAEIVAGAGMTGGIEPTALGLGFSTTLNIGQGDGIIVGDESISVNYGGSGSATTVSRSDHSHSTLTRGTGLTGSNYNGSSVQHGLYLMSNSRNSSSRKSDGNYCSRRRLDGRNRKQ
jgi:hypothetical protein